MRFSGGPLAALALLVLQPIPSAALAAVVEDPGQGPVELERSGTRASQLSAIAHVEGERYYTAGERGRVYTARIELDPKTGRILATGLEGGVRLAGARDVEGIALTGRNTLLACDEVGPAIREHRLADGSVAGTISVPAVFHRARINRSLESLSLAEDGQTLWTANEESLRVDGPRSNGEGGSVVRLQRFRATEAGFEPDGQWAYRTDPWPGGPMGGWESSGVVDLLATPGGDMLVLERSFSDRGFRARIYQVAFEKASDTSKHASLEGEPFTPVAKTLLWEANRLGFNFEGITLGPPLASGARSLLLVADDSGVLTPHLYALRLRDGAPSGAPQSPPSP